MSKEHSKFHNSISIQGNMHGDINTAENIQTNRGAVYLDSHQLAQAEASIRKFVEESIRVDPDPQQDYRGALAEILKTVEGQRVQKSHLRAALDGVKDLTLGVASSLFASIVVAQNPWLWT